MDFDLYLFIHCFIFFQMMKKVSKYISEQNERVWAPRGLLVTNPIERGLRVVSF